MILTMNVPHIGFFRHQDSEIGDALRAESFGVSNPELSCRDFGVWPKKGLGFRLFPLQTRERFRV